MTDQHEQPTPDQALAARLQLEVAVQQLVTPAVHHLDRSRAETTPEVAQVDADADLDHRDQMTRLRGRHADALRRRDAAGARRALAALIHREQTYRAQRAARELASAAVPPLLEQLQAAVESSTGAGTGSAGPHRAAIGLDAAELLGDIERTTGHRYTCSLASTLQSWATRVANAAGPAELLHHAQRAEQWVSAARAIVTPDRGFEIQGACPLCGTRYVWVQDGDERLRKAALQITYATRSARCIAPGCTGRWGPEYLEHLARVVVQDRDERVDVRPA